MHSQRLVLHLLKLHPIESGSASFASTYITPFYGLLIQCCSGTRIGCNHVGATPSHMPYAKMHLNDRIVSLAHLLFCSLMHSSFSLGFVAYRCCCITTWKILLLPFCRRWTGLAEHKWFLTIILCFPLLEYWLTCQRKQTMTAIFTFSISWYKTHTVAIRVPLTYMEVFLYAKRGVLFGAFYSCYYSPLISPPPS